MINQQGLKKKNPSGNGGIQNLNQTAVNISESNDCLGS